MLALQTIPGESSVDACARTLREAVLRGQFAPGARLPPERALAEHFGVNRVTLRGALARLCSEHLLSARQGSGYLVHDYRRVGGLELLPTLMTLGPSSNADYASIVRDVLLVRRQLARAIFERFAESPQPAGIARVEIAVAQLAKVVDAGGDELAIAEADLAVASELVAATRSGVLALCLNPVLSIVRQTPRLRSAMYRSPRDNLLGYRALLAWLHRPDPKKIDTLLEVLASVDEKTVEAVQVRGSPPPNPATTKLSKSKEGSRR